MISYFAEINKVRVTLFNLEKKPLSLPDEEGPKITLTEKLFVPVKEHPDVSVPHMLSEALKCEIGFVVYLSTFGSEGFTGFKCVKLCP